MPGPIVICLELDILKIFEDRYIAIKETSLFGLKRGNAAFQLSTILSFINIESLDWFIGRNKSSGRKRIRIINLRDLKLICKALDEDKR
ncbi:hypothetical protein EPI10_025705 [Gossypium australe]|uniref:Uncharacterized protein n=1 Tax=Gossypium australe TaxID=47621 RepID=A0A5B6W2T8_9ROSI|nr:hypothetical protein EPI10_025705 [Gossypium australe]